MSLSWRQEHLSLPQAPTGRLGRRARRAWKIAVVLCVLGVGLGSTGQALAAGTMEQAKGWFQEGDKAEEAGDCTTAIAKFRLALGVKETPQLHLRVGRCQDKLGAVGDALQSYRKARALAEGNEKVVPVVDEQIAALKPRVPALSIATKNPPPGFVVTVNGTAITSFAEPLYENPGDLVIAAHAEGFKPFEAKVHLDVGDKKTVTIDLSPLPAAPTPHPAPDSGPGGPHPASIVVLGVGVVGVGVGIGLAVHGFGLKSDLENDSKFGCHVPAGKTTYTCKNPSFGGKSATNVQSQSNTFQAAGFATLAVGGAALAAGAIVMGVTWQKKPAADPAPIAVTPVAGPGLGGLWVDGRF